MTTKICDKCRHGNRLYRLFYTSYHKDKKILCGLSDNFCDINGFCENWERKGKDYDLSPRRFDKAEQDIKVIFKLLEE